MRKNGTSHYHFALVKAVRYVTLSARSLIGTPTSDGKHRIHQQRRLTGAKPDERTTTMISKAKTALVAAFVIGSASAALAQASDEVDLRNPSAPVAIFQYSAEPQARLLEGRNVAVRQAPVSQTEANAFDRATYGAAGLQR